MRETGMTPEERLKKMQLELPKAPAPVGAYVPVVRVGSLAWTSGQLPMREGKLLCAGTVGGEVEMEAAAECARVAALNALAALAGTLGNLTKVKRIVQMVGYVASAPEFTQQHLVLNKASEFLVEVFGEAGRHTRAAVGVNSLPLNAPVEVMLLVEVTD